MVLENGPSDHATLINYASLESTEPDFTVFPNPSNGMVTVTITDLTGKVILSETIKQLNTNLDLIHDDQTTDTTMTTAIASLV